MKSLKSQYEFKYQASDEQLDIFASEEDDRVIAKLKEKLTFCAGVDAELQRLHKDGIYHLSIVSGSALRRIRASIEKVGFERYFGAEVIFSASDSLQNPASKPNPAIYLHALEVLNRSPGECVAIEDSGSGALAACRAGIKTIGYVGCYKDEKKAHAEKILRDSGCEVIMNHWEDFQICLEAIWST